MTTVKQPPSYPLSQTMELLTARLWNLLDEKKAMTLAWMSSTKRSESCLALQRKGRSFRWSFISDGSLASKTPASPDWPVATAFLDLQAFTREWGGGNKLANQSTPGMTEGGQRPIDGVGQSALP